LKNKLIISVLKQFPQKNDLRKILQIQVQILKPPTNKSNPNHQPNPNPNPLQASPTARVQTILVQPINQIQTTNQSNPTTPGISNRKGNNNDPNSAGSSGSSGGPIGPPPGKGNMGWNPNEMNKGGMDKSGMGKDKGGNKNFDQLLGDVLGKERLGCKNGF